MPQSMVRLSGVFLLAVAASTAHAAVFTSDVVLQGPGSVASVSVFPIAELRMTLDAGDATVVVDWGTTGQSDGPSAFTVINLTNNTGETLDALEVAFGSYLSDAFAIAAGRTLGLPSFFLEVSRSPAILPDGTLRYEGLGWEAGAVASLNGLFVPPAAPPGSQRGSFGVLFVNSVPEPATGVLLAPALLVMRRRR